MHILSLKLNGKDFIDLKVYISRHLPPFNSIPSLINIVLSVPKLIMSFSF